MNCIVATACSYECNVAVVSRLYIMTMNVLAPYRRQGIAADLLTHVLEKAREDPSIVEAYLHGRVPTYIK